MTRPSPALPAIAAWLALTACGSSPAPPPTSTSTIYETTFENRNIDKVDILFDIDNSRQMWDAQGYLKAAVPDLVDRIINPGCVDALGVFVGDSYLGSCEQHPGTKLEFPPIHDLHLGIVTSSLGGRLGDACDPQQAAPPPFGNVSAHNDDQAHLLNRSLTYSPPPPSAPSSVSEGVVADAPAGAPFLYWFPSALNAGWPGPGTPIAQSVNLLVDFTEIVGGAGVYGCELQSPLESWYRFLVQPDPYASLVLDGSGKAQWSGVDTTLLRQRHDFLRPDSMVIVVVVSADDDKEVDVRSVGGTGYKWLSGAFDPPRGTSACATDPASPACKPCTEPGTAGDPSCAMGPYSTPGDGGHDLATRFSHMKAKYGVDPQYPLQRYVNGLTSTTVPDRGGEYPPGATSYVGTRDCMNPLFAAALPDGSSTDHTVLCYAPPGTSRTKNMVSYVHIGGVPYQLLHFTPGDAAASTLTDSDWVKILGKDPLHYDTTGIDPHMIESSQPRPGVAPPGSANGTDPISSHDWITDTGAGPVSLEYACVFPLVDSYRKPRAARLQS